MLFVTVAAATLPSVPLDFAGNRDRILESIRIAKQKGATLRTGPEAGTTHMSLRAIADPCLQLEIPGYGCLDHHLGRFFLDISSNMSSKYISGQQRATRSFTVGRCWPRSSQTLYAKTSSWTWAWVCATAMSGITVVCSAPTSACSSFGKALFSGGCSGNLRCDAYLVRSPKMSLANDGLYREARHFTAWPKKMQVETYYLEAIIEKVTGQHTVPIGDAILSTLDTAVGCETCEELFTPSNPSTYMGLNVSERPNQKRKSRAIQSGGLSCHLGLVPFMVVLF